MFNRVQLFFPDNNKVKLTLSYMTKESDEEGTIKCCSLSWKSKHVCHSRTATHFYLLELNRKIKTEFSLENATTVRVFRGFFNSTVFPFEWAVD